VTELSRVQNNFAFFLSRYELGEEYNSRREGEKRKVRETFYFFALGEK
jgi:hypothetical protein